MACTNHEVDESCSQPEQVISVVEKQDRRTITHPGHRKKRYYVHVVGVENHEVRVLVEGLEPRGPRQKSAWPFVEYVQRAAGSPNTFLKFLRHGHVLARERQRVNILTIVRDPAAEHAAVTANLSDPARHVQNVEPRRTLPLRTFQWFVKRQRGLAQLTDKPL